MVLRRKAEGVNQGRGSGTGEGLEYSCIGLAKLTLGEREGREARKTPFFLAWAAGGMVVSFTEIAKTEGRTDFVGEDGELGFGRVQFEMHMGNLPSAV